jgi:hypothetical protein
MMNRRVWAVKQSAATGIRLSFFWNLLMGSWLYLVPDLAR